MVSSSRWACGGRFGRRLGGGERFRDGLERLALGVDAEQDLDDTSEHHDPRADEVADEVARRARPVAYQGTVEEGAERAEDLRDGEEDRDRLGTNLYRPGLADCEVGRRGTRRGEEED